MAIGNPHDREYFVIGGAVKTSGGSLNLTKGELNISLPLIGSEPLIKVDKEVTASIGLPTRDTET